MPLEILNALSDYESKNADILIINRSVIYIPVLMKNTDKEFTYRVVGSLGENYIITIGWNNNLRVYSSCTCPYDKPGICKHRVAAIRELKKVIKSKKIESLQEIVSKKEVVVHGATDIPVIDGTIDVEQLSKIVFSQTPYYAMPAAIVSVSSLQITGVYSDYRKDYNLNLIYRSNKDTLTLTCTCGAKGNCFHKYMFLNQVLKRFPKDFFAADFEKRLKERTLKDKGIEGDWSFDDLYVIDISKNGVQVQEKVKNLLFAEKGPIQLFQNRRKDFFLPKTQPHKDKYGLGICIQLNNNAVVNIFPFTGKLNKANDQISTKLREVSKYDAHNSLQFLLMDSEVQAALDILQLSAVYEQYMRTSTEEGMRSLWEKVQQLKHLFKKYPIFIYKDRQSFVRKHLKLVQVNEEQRFKPVLKVTETDKFYQLDVKLQFENQTYVAQSNLLRILPIGVVLRDDLYLFNSPDQAYLVNSLTENSQYNVAKTDLKTFQENVINPFSVFMDIDFPGLKKVKQHTNPIPVEKQVYLSDEEGMYIVLRPVMQYGEQQVEPGSMEKIWSAEEALAFLERNEEEEQEFLKLLRGLHPEFKHKTNYFYLSNEQALESLWLMEAIDQLRNNDVKVFGLNTLSNLRYNLNKPTFSISLSSGTDWFDMNIDIAFGDQKVDLKSLQKAIVNKQQYVELKDGTLGLLPQEWLEKYKKYFKLGQVKKDKIEISNYQFNIIDELYQEMTNTPTFLEELHQKKKRLTNLSALKPVAVPKGLKAKLRTYQQEGLNWLVFLDENKLGGCLADDMGLGKTLQTIAFILHLKNTTPKKERKPHLIIAPTSLMFNWQAEIEKFAPTLKMLAYIGPNREELRPLIGEQDIVLSTYGSVINDIHFHKGNHYGYVVLDESQAIKNPESQRFKAVRLLRCDNRLALTGTPIENNTFDLYSQFNFLNPGIFGSVKHFKATFSDAIDKEQDAYTSQLLARMIHPFILRRTKTQVATELPPKTESVIYCEMGSEQRKVYDEFKLYFRQKLLEQIEEEGENKSQMYILQGLTKLRQICNSTALADKTKDYGNHSAKLDELTRHLKEKVNKHKVLVFSQFVGMLQLIKARLQAEGIAFEYLDGQTTNREEKVNNFQSNNDIRVFLISLKAGGTGLNLTEADYVYLIDPWWNPAVESQAIDRSYRIGQDKKVMAYRMICKDTIEEKIVQLQNKKKTVAAEVIQIDTEKKSFKKEDVELFFGN